MKLRRHGRRWASGLRWSSGRRTWRWIGLKVMLFVVAFLLMLPVLLPIFLTALRSGSHMNKGAMLVSFLGAFSLALPWMLQKMTVYTVGLLGDLGRYGR